MTQKKKPMESDKKTFTKLKAVLDYVWKNPYSSFYRLKYTKLNINLSKDINSMDDFLKLPYLTKNEMMKYKPFERLYIHPNKIIQVDVTSGTTSNSTAPYVSFRGKPTLAQKKFLYANAVKYKIKRALALRKILGRTVTNNNTPFMIVMGDLNNLYASAKVAAQIEIDCIFATATVLYYFIPYLKKEYDLNKIRYIRMGGEYVSEKRLNFLKKNFPNAHFDLNFGFTEAMGFGNQCKYLDKISPKFFHFMPAFHYETFNPGVENELVITTLHAKNIAFPLIRYRSGDSVKIEEFACPCGETLRMEVLGRIGYDLVKISGTSIYVDYVYKALEPFQKYLNSPEWQLHLYEEEKGDKLLPKLKLQLEPKKADKDLQRLLETGIAKNLYLSAKATLADLVGKGAFLPLEVEFVTEFPVEVKKKHIISHLV